MQLIQFPGERAKKRCRDYFFTTTKYRRNEENRAYLVFWQEIKKLFKKMAQIPLTYFRYDAILKFHCESRGITSKKEDQTELQKKVKKLLTDTAGYDKISKLLLKLKQQKQKSF